MQMQNLSSYLHSQLQQHGTDASELWLDSDAMHIIMRTTHQAGTMHLLAWLSILSVHIHKASTVILFPSTEAQQLFKQHADSARAQAHQVSMAPSAAVMTSLTSALGQGPIHEGTTTSMPGSVDGFTLHEEQLTLECGSPVTVMSPQASQQSTAPLPEQASLQDSHQQPQPIKPPRRFVLCIADHDLCTSDAQLHSFWANLHRQQQQQQQQQQQTIRQENTQAGKSAAMLLSKPFGHLGSLWHIVSMTYSLPGLASTLTGTKQPGFSTHLIQTGLPKDCTTHPMMLPAEQKRSGIQRRITPHSAAVASQQAQDKNTSLVTWYGSHPGLLQWLTSLTEATASSPCAAADPRLIMVVGAPQLAFVDHIVEHAEASGLSLTVLELDSAEGAMLTASSDCFTVVADSFNFTVLAPDTKGRQATGFLPGVCAPKLMFSKRTSPAERVSAMCDASASAAAALGKPIHGVLLLSWEMLLRLPATKPAHTRAVTDLYLIDLAEAIAPGSKAPLTQMAAYGLHAVTHHLCGVCPR